MNAAFHYTFQRTEKKYLLTLPVFEQFFEQIKPYIQPDEYGRSTICNIYYDTEHYDLISRSIDGPPYKEKLRLRSYGVPGPKDTVFLELKKKYKGTVFKRRISLPLEEAEGYLEKGIPPREQGQIFQEIDYFCRFYRPQPRLFSWPTTGRPMWGRRIPASASPLIRRSAAAPTISTWATAIRAGSISRRTIALWS